MLEFFGDFMTFTGGVITIAFWIVLIVLATIEIMDRINERKSTTLDDEED